MRIGGSFNTIIGLIFLVIVLVSPDGLMGVWDRLWGLGAGGERRRAERDGDPGRREGVRRKEGASQIVTQGSIQRLSRSIVNQGGQQA